MTTEMTDLSETDILANVLKVQYLRDEAAAWIKARRREDLPKLKGKPIRAWAHRQMREHARRIQEDHPSQAIVRLEARLKRVARAARAPLPWERDPSWSNPYSSEYYSACGYEDMLCAQRDELRDEAKYLRRQIRVMKKQGMVHVHEPVSD